MPFCLLGNWFDYSSVGLASQRMLLHDVAWEELTPYTHQASVYKPQAQQSMHIHFLLSRLQWPDRSDATADSRRLLGRDNGKVVKIIKVHFHYQTPCARPILAASPDTGLYTYRSSSTRVHIWASVIALRSQAFLR